MTVTAAALAMVAASCAGAGEPDHQPPDSQPPDHQPPGGPKPPGRGKPKPGTPEEPPVPQPFCQGDGWCWENPLPQGNTLTGVWIAPRGTVPGSNDTFAVGALGIIQRRHAGGWIIDDSGVSVTLRGVWGSAGNDVWAVGDGGTIVHFDGKHWSTIASGTTSDLKAVWVASAADAWIAGLGDTLLHFNGAAWVPVAPPVAGNDFHGVFGIAANNVWAVGERHLPSGGQSGIVMHWNGELWADAFVAPERPQYTGTITYTTVWASSGADIWVGGFDILRGAADIFGTMIHFDGTSWDGPEPSGGQLAGHPITSIFGASPSDVWAAPRLHWDGADWSSVFTERTEGIIAINGRATDDVVGVGRDGRVLHFDGATWEDWNTTLTDETIVDVWGAANGELFAVTATMILHHDGRGWSRAFHGAGAQFVAVSGSSPDNVVFLREDGETLYWDGESVFSLIPADRQVPGERFTNLWTSGRFEVWATAFNVTVPFGTDLGRVYRLVTYPQNWLQIQTTPGAARAITGTSPNDIWVGGEEPAVHHFDGTTWTTVPLAASPGVIFVDLWANSPTDVWLTGFAGPAVLHWDGVAFTPMPATGSPTGANAIWSNGPNNVWTAGSNGVVHWDGEAWTPSATDVTAFPSWRAIWQTPDGKVRVFGDGGAILRK